MVEEMTEITIYPGKFYVYEWLSENDESLYIGKGTGRRAWHFDRAEFRERMGNERPAHARILLWVDSEKDALDYEWRLIQIRSPRWNILRPIYRDGYQNPRKDYPQCRHAIIKLGMRPFIKDGSWDGHTFIGPEGRRTGATLRMKQQARIMFKEGYWGDIPIKRKPWWDLPDMDNNGVLR